MKKLLFAFCLFTSSIAQAQPYTPNWESLDKRPIPSWFSNDKFGIFIHWGMYSVPGYTAKGNYAEWYQQYFNRKDSAIVNYHKAKYGDRTYYDLANDFKAELFKPEEWASLFEKSGAKYIVLTSKHHDGYALWPSEETRKAWGFPWTSMDVGPKRDLIGDLFAAVRKTSVRAGMYYSLYEWFNPLWKSDPAKFAEQHTWPQMKDLINRYQPDVFWTDGDWDAPAELWKSQEFLAWLYNQSPVKDKVVVNDRWGAGIRFHHGGIYTPEYQPDLDFEDHAWEESRGMGFSYGYNREEDAWDYNSTQSLVLQLIDKVSRGGNFLLDIGPDEHGKIPPIMQERLLEIGQWLKLNGAAIYNTRRWKNSSQWSAGRKDYKDRSGDMLLKITVDPDPGYAVKEVFYTHNPIVNDLYAILPRYPQNLKMVLRDMQLPVGTKLDLLSTGQSLIWKQAGANVEVQLPEYNPSLMKAPWAWVIRIKGYGAYTSKPKADIEYKDGQHPLISLSGPAGSKICYTTDGSTPTIKSALYAKPFTIPVTSVVKAIAIKPGQLSSGIVETTVKVYLPMKARIVGKTAPGLQYKYVEAADLTTDKVIAAAATKTGITPTFNTSVKERTDKYGLVFTGYFQQDKESMVEFFTSSDDGSLLYIDDELIVDNNGSHGMEERSGKALLAMGWHSIRVVYYDGGGGNGLKVSYKVEGGEKKEMPAEMLWH
jgi:alpha-L-fucosidase